MALYEMFDTPSNTITRNSSTQPSNTITRNSSTQPSNTISTFIDGQIKYEWVSPEEFMNRPTTKILNNLGIVSNSSIQKALVNGYRNNYSGIYSTIVEWQSTGCEYNKLIEVGYDKDGDISSVHNYPSKNYTSCSGKQNNVDYRMPAAGNANNVILFKGGRVVEEQYFFDDGTWITAKFNNGVSEINKYASNDYLINKVIRNDKDNTVSYTEYYPTSNKTKTISNIKSIHKFKAHDLKINIHNFKEILSLEMHQLIPMYSTKLISSIFFPKSPLLNPKVIKKPAHTKVYTSVHKGSQEPVPKITFESSLQSKNTLKSLTLTTDPQALSIKTKYEFSNSNLNKATYTLEDSIFTHLYKNDFLKTTTLKIKNIKIEANYETQHDIPMIILSRYVDDTIAWKIKYNMRDQTEASGSELYTWSTLVPLERTIQQPTSIKSALPLSIDWLTDMSKVEGRIEIASYITQKDQFNILPFYFSRHPMDTLDNPIETVIYDASGELSWSSSIRDGIMMESVKTETGEVAFMPIIKSRSPQHPKYRDLLGLEEFDVGGYESTPPFSYPPKTTDSWTPQG